MPNRKPEESTEKGLLKLLTLRDLITIISVAVSIALAWGVFSTRIALLERDAVDDKVKIEELRKDSLEKSSTIRAIDIQVQKNSLYIDQLLQAAGKNARR